MKINISFLNPIRVSSFLMRLFFPTSGMCFTVLDGLSAPGCSSEVFKAGDPEAEASRQGMVCSLAHSKSEQVICTQGHRLLGQFWLVPLVLLSEVTCYMHSPMQLGELPVS